MDIERVVMKKPEGLPVMTPELVCYLSEMQSSWSASYHQRKKEKAVEFYAIHKIACDKWRNEHRDYLSNYRKEKRRRQKHLNNLTL